MPVVLLIRHAQGSFGSSDYDVLTETGEQQAVALHHAFAERGVAPDRMVAGALRRQRDTALPWTRAGEELALDPRWDEYDLDAVLRAHTEVPASLEGLADGPPMTTRDFQAVVDPTVERWIEADGDAASPDSFRAFRARATGALQDLAGTLRRGETAFAFTSGGVIAACAVDVLGLPDKTLVPLNRMTVNTGVTKLITGSRGLNLVSFNEHGHLEADGLVTYR